MVLQVILITISAYAYSEKLKNKMKKQKVAEVFTKFKFGKLFFHVEEPLDVAAAMRTPNFVCNGDDCFRYIDLACRTCKYLRHQEPYASADVLHLFLNVIFTLQKAGLSKDMAVHICRNYCILPCRVNLKCPYAKTTDGSIVHAHCCEEIETLYREGDGEVAFFDF